MNQDEYRVLWNEIVRFVDAFRRDPSIEILQKEPSYDDDISNAFYAGLVGKLATDYNFVPPQWIFKKKYFLNEPIFIGGYTGAYNVFLLTDTPLDFKARNIFVASNTFDRV